MATLSENPERATAQELLLKYQSLCNTLFNRSLMPKWICDCTTLSYLEVNEKAIEHYGFSREEFLKMSPFDICHPEEHQALKEFINEGSLETFNRKVRHIKRSGEVLFVEVTVYQIPYKEKEAILIIADDITETLSLERQLFHERLNKQLEINRITIDIQEKERAVIGKELHDNVNQMLTTAKVYLEHVLDNMQQRSLLKNAMNIVNSSIEEIRKLSRRLVPPSLGDISLKDAICDLADSIEVVKKYSVLLGISKLDESDLSDGLKLTIFRILQEQLNNILKYAEATEIKISLNQNPTSLILTIQDNGKGFNTNCSSKGIGIRNITNRAHAYNGKVNINSAPGEGCTLFVHFILSH
ncbi:MAG: PAS domain S-box protein [Flavisolibacter sp.]|nr:PAS domain S-box protein [Flavisolibacter sp.]